MPGARSVIALFLLALFSPRPLPAADHNGPSVQYSHDVWDVNRGLSAFSINAITQTLDGYLWLGTDEGLIRFDGVRFSLYNTVNTPDLRHNNVSALSVQEDSSLWIATNGGGLCRLRKGEFNGFGAEQGLSDKMLLSLAAGRGGDLWIGTAASGLLRMRNGSFARVGQDFDREIRPIYAVGAGIGGALFAGVANRFGVISPNTDSLRKISVLGSLILSICQLRDGSVVLGTLTGVFLSDGTTVRPFPVEAIAAIPSARAIVEDHDGNLWIGTEGHGLFRYSQGTLTRLGPGDGVVSDRILSICEDAERNLWVGTRGGGLMRFRRSTIVMLSTTPQLPSGQISTVFERSGGELWIGTRDAGLFVVRDGTLVRRYTAQEGLADNFIRSFFGDTAGNVWIGTQGGLQMLRHGGGSPVRLQTAEGHPIGSVRSCIEARDGTIWIGSSADGVYAVRRGAAFPSRMPRTVHGEYIPVRVLLEDHQGRIWVGTRGGLAVVEDDTMKQFTAANAVPVREIFAFHEDAAGALWIGTYGEGLFRLKNGVLARCTMQQGLFDDVIYTILDDGLGAFWMSCNKGIFRVSQQELNDLADGRSTSVTSTSFGTADGMQSVECNGGSQPSGWNMGDGRFLFPTMKGVAVVHPGQVQETSREPLPVIEELVVGDRTLSAPAEATLEPGTRKFDANYTGLSFVIPERIEFRYILEGFDEHWTEAFTARKASYTNIPPGEYMFRVAARHPGGEWTARTASLRVIVQPHLWETAWFRAAAGAFLLVGMFLLTRVLATRKLKQELRELEAQRSLDRERERISRDMHDEVGASLTQIAILSELLQRNISQKGAAETYLKKISTTAQGVVESLDEIVWFINPKHDSLESLLFYIREHLTDFFESAELACRFDFPEVIPPLPLSADARRDIFMAVKEAATNVVKHAGATSVHVRVRVDAGAVELRIEDNGKGMSEEQRSAFGNGLENMRRRMGNIGGTCEIGASTGGGTVVTVRADVRR